jgi:hypothetical protein
LNHLHWVRTTVRTSKVGSKVHLHQHYENAGTCTFDWPAVLVLLYTVEILEVFNTKPILLYWYDNKTDASELLMLNGIGEA